ncbi:MAG: elongation factor G [Chthonomonas sp.]|nr:elongation factor G [Chthonomonas sp.]
MQKYTADKIRNVAIVGHGGSGKTMLAEHMLYTSGATERVGTTDAGSSQADFDPLEVKRHISIAASVLPLEWHGHKINLIDCPGYPDFIGDLHGVARVVEAMILVCEAKRDLDVGFELAWEIAEQHGLAKCIFVNKLERDNADYEGLMETLHARYGRKIVGVQIPIGHQAAFSGVLDLLNMKVYKGKDRGEEIEDIPAGYSAEAEERREKMMDAAAEGDDALAEKYLDGQELTAEEIEHGLLVGTETGRVVPVMVGSAASGVGIATLLDRIIGELPSPVEVPKVIDGKTWEPKADGPVSAFCFKTTADPYVGRINYLRIFGGTLKQDAILSNPRSEHDEKVHNLFYPHGKAQETAPEIIAGDICAVAKLQHTATGDTLTNDKNGVAFPAIAFPEAVYRIAIKPVTKVDEDKLGPSIDKLIEEDPTLRYTRDGSLHQEILEGLGDIHLEVAIEKLKSRFGVTVTTEDAKVPYRETIRGSAKAQGRHKRQTGGKGQFGDCWLRVEPTSRGTGFEFGSEVVGGSIPKNFIPAIEKGIRETLGKGFLAGYPVVDIKAVVYDGSYHDVDSSEAAFKIAGSLGFKAAAAAAQPVILEPIMDFEIDIPDECVGDVVGDLNGRRGHMQGMDPIAPGKTRVRASVPMATTMRYALELRSITKGRGRFTASINRYDPLPDHESKGLIAEYEKMRAAHEEESHH